METMKRLVILVALAAGLVTASSSNAATIDVNTTEDAYGGSAAACSLREAITAAQTNAAFDGCSAGSGPDIISVPDGEYRITRAGADEDNNVTGDFDVTGTNALIIEPSTGNDRVVVDGNAIDRVFDQQGANQLSLRNLEIRGGKLTLIEDGAGIRNSVGELTVDGSTVTGNDSAFQGGAVAVYSQTVAVNSTFSANTADGNGGGFYIPGGGTLTLRSSTVTANVADADNNGNGHGGGFSDSAAASVNFTNTINAANTDRSAAPIDAPDCQSGPTFFPDYVLSVQPLGPVPCLVGFDPGTNKVVADPMVGPLQDNGGQTPTHALLEGSPAIGAGAPAGPDQCPARDQTGRDRPLDGCDIGAVQYVEPTPPPPPAVAVKFVKVKPKPLKLKRGKKARKVSVVVRTTGAAAAPNTRVCVRKPGRAVRRSLKIRGKLCRNLGTMSGKRTVRFKIAAKKKAKRKAFRLKVRLTAEGASSKSAFIKVKVR
jgi:CSLREA domain-containing protein